MIEPQTANLLKSVLHNIGVVVIGFGIAIVGTLIDPILGIAWISSSYAIAIGTLFLVIGFLFRVWAGFQFYEHQAKVISSSRN
jgi:protein-S-isoprenylcysteine O-methyltransferase Ste14